uniref:Hexosyltransferase n=1 Tax=Aureoumbra lagunensis TaxID=44058 RepID=A0A7S3NGS9_9STRA|mmetsp:Transcript_1723/g.2633  ORF Transcript_1723/g.2633 Transcript_1723/m.2633 type:complete len:395 (+) Transcript_1723:23-1207(+)
MHIMMSFWIGLTFIVVCLSMSYGEDWQRNEVIRLVEAMNKKNTHCLERKDEERRKRLGVCVTGQLSRLELESKIRRLISLNSEAYEIDMVFVLGTNTHFVNGETDAGGRAEWSAELIRKAVRHWAPRVARVVVDAGPQLERPYIELSYLQASDKPWLGKARIESHVRQWWSLLRCWKHFIHLACKRQAPYQTFVKLRDDAFLLAPIILKNMNIQDLIVLPECGNFAGYNDKWAFLDATLGRAYFAMPVFEYYTNYSSLNMHKGNPENLLKRVLIKHQAPVSAVSVDILPILTSRFRTNEISGQTFPQNITPASCFLFDQLKLGKEPHCWPSDCDRRRAIYCDRCTVKRQEWLRDHFLERDSEFNSEQKAATCTAECRHRPISITSFASFASISK